MEPIDTRRLPRMANEKSKLFKSRKLYRYDDYQKSIRKFPNRVYKKFSSYNLKRLREMKKIEELNNYPIYKTEDYKYDCEKILKSFYDTTSYWTSYAYQGLVGKKKLIPSFLFHFKKINNVNSQIYQVLFPCIENSHITLASYFRMLTLTPSSHINIADEPNRYLFSFESVDEECFNNASKKMETKPIAYLNINIKRDVIAPSSVPNSDLLLGKYKVVEFIENSSSEIAFVKLNSVLHKERFIYLKNNKYLADVYVDFKEYFKERSEPMMKLRLILEKGKNALNIPIFGLTLQEIAFYESLYG